jgi:hypothetical protein
MSAQAAINTQLEALQEFIPLSVEKDDTLDKKIQDNGRAKKVSKKSYRVLNETALPGTGSMVDLDSTTVGLPTGGSSEFSQLTVTPQSFGVTIEWTKLAELMNGNDVAIVNVVSHQVGRATDRLRQLRDMLLQTDGTGKLATIAAGGVAGPDGDGNYTLTLSSTPFGGRLLVKNQPVGCFNGDAKRGDLTVKSISKSLGGTHTVVVIPAAGFTGAPTAGDFIRFDNVTDGGPVCINGIPAFHQTATTGTTLGLDRSLPANAWIIANGVAANGAQITQPLLDLPFNQIRQELGAEGVKNLILHTSPAQVAALKEMGYALEYIPMNGGKAEGFDPLFRGQPTVGGYQIVANIHAATDRWDYMNLQAWGKVKHGNPPFWYEVGGNRALPIYASNGSVTAGFRSHLIDIYQYFIDQAKSISSITGCKVPTGY